MKAEEFSKLLKKSNGHAGCCPAHEDTTESLSFKDEGDRLLVKCFAGCSAEQIVSALGLKLSDLFHTPRRKNRKKQPSAPPNHILTVAELAHAKMIPPSFLEALGVHDTPKGVAIPTYAPGDPDDRPSGRLHIRLSLERKPKFMYTTDGPEPCIPYWVPSAPGITGLAFITEGESDLWTLRYWVGVGGIALPGASTAKKIEPEHLAGVDVIYVFKDTDEPKPGKVPVGEKFAQEVHRRVREIGWGGTLHIVSMPDGIKDPSALWLDCVTKAQQSGENNIHLFLRRLHEAVLTAVRLEDIDLEPALVPEVLPSSNKYLPTSLGNSERLVDSFGRDLMHVHELGWLAWSGTRWAQDPGGYVVQRAAKKIVRNLLEEAQRLLDRAETEADLATAQARQRWAMQCQCRAKIDEMSYLAREALLREHGDLDQHPMLFNVINGTLDLKTGELRPHDRADFITQISPVTYDPAAMCPTWERFVSEIMCGRKDLVNFLQRLVGYILTGDITEEVFVVLYGIGSNGKSKFLETLRGLLGSEYAKGIPVGTLMQKRDSGSGPSPDIARLRGARLATAVEPEKGRAVAEGIIKSMTGGDTMPARHLYRELFDFKATYKLLLATNHKPKVPGGTLGMWRRIKLVPFEATFQGAARDNTMGAKLMAELPGILNWAAAGTREWLARGLAEPAEVRAATEEYREEEQALGDFWSECCVFGPKLQVPMAELIEAYRRWCEANGEKPMSTTALGRLLTDKGIKRDPVWDGAKGKTVKVYRGIGLTGLTSLTGLTGSTNSPRDSDGMPGDDEVPF